MQYRKFGNTGFDVSVLGFGCMRFPLTGDAPDAPVDDDEAIRMIRAAIDSGVNYIDTAYVYHNGRSESITGRALKKGYRDKVKIATKSPTFIINKEKQFDTILDEQLKRLDVDHIDFYLIHSLNGRLWDNVVKRFDIMHKAEQAIKSGKIGHIGFSFHDAQPEFFRIMDEYDKWEFCQIQLNYLNENYQAGLKGLSYAAQKGLGVIVMEPLLGGRLAKPIQSVVDTFHAANPERSVCEWAFDYIWNMPEVSVTLSGMSTMAQVQENVACAQAARPGMLSAADMEAIRAAQRQFEQMGSIACTKCNYCLPCPSGVNIPANFQIYNELFLYETPHLTKAEYAFLGDRGNARATANNCAKCGACEEKCPQHLPISELMEKIHATLG